MCTGYSFRDGAIVVQSANQCLPIHGVEWEVFNSPHFNQLYIVSHCTIQSYLCHKRQLLPCIVIISLLPFTHTHTHFFCCYQQSLYVSPTSQMPPHLMGKRRKAMLAKSEYLKVEEEKEGGWSCLYGEYQARRLLRCM